MLMLIAAAMLGQIAAQGPYQLSESDVQACGSLAVRRNEHRTELDRMSAALDGRLAELRAKQAEVTAAREGVDAKNKKAVARYNQQIDAANALRAAVQPEIDARDRYGNETNQLIAAFNAKCANRGFDPAYLALLPSDQQAALKDKSTTRTVRVPAAAPKKRR